MSMTPDTRDQQADAETEPRMLVGQLVYCQGRYECRVEADHGDTITYVALEGYGPEWNRLKQWTAPKYLFTTTRDAGAQALRSQTDQGTCATCKWLRLESTSGPLKECACPDSPVGIIAAFRWDKFGCLFHAPLPAPPTGESR